MTMSIALASPPPSPSRKQWTLTFTGYGFRGRLIVLLNEHRVPLTVDQYELLALFATNRLSTATGRVTAHDIDVKDVQHFRTKVYRLRKAINEALGSRVGEEVIQSGLFEEYSLAVSPDAIRIDHSCRDLPNSSAAIDWKSLQGLLPTSCDSP